MKFSLFLCIMLAVAFFAINLFLVLTTSPRNFRAYFPAPAASCVTPAR
ncbi:hypothetical protein [Desulfovibrio sp. MES5]|nr:hypothetical protein [Desulfovibrio sp. MES5]